MIAKLTGMVDSFADSSVVIDVGGVGYLVFCSSRTLSGLPQIGSPATLCIETHVREDHIHLFGFADEIERDWFNLLLSVQGVGAKVALALLSALTPHDLSLAIAAQDKAAVGQANGVGPKLAARIVSELKDKAGNISLAPPGLEVISGNGGQALKGASGVAEDAVSALVNLGYRRMEAYGAVSHVAGRLGDGAGVEALIPEALKELAS